MRRGRTGEGRRGLERSRRRRGQREGEVQARAQYVFLHLEQRRKAPRPGKGSTLKQDAQRGPAAIAIGTRAGPYARAVGEERKERPVETRMAALRWRGASLLFRSVPRLARTTATAASRPVEGAISHKLATALEPAHLEVVNESGGHNVPRGSETHFKVIVVSDRFEGKALLERHRMVNALLADEFGAGLHALSIVAKTPAQWVLDTTVPRSPPCRGGSGEAE